MSHRPTRIFPMSIAEFVVSAAGTALTIYAVGAVLGVRFFG